jgi:SpoVK/Ycf46/Vps4 family AAA+-type ATPase
MGLIDNLVLKPHYKTMIQSLSKNFMEQKTSAPVKSHDALNSTKDTETSHSWSADFIENKGKGLIFLLHGKPGVGKTYTAECISEHVRRPLLPITCADIGVEPSEVEERLVRWFKIARSWDAVMLLDEADIYMEYRQIHDLNRNNLVASFLRAIEYYEGILFLTTNRVGTFDEAFLSRINLAIYYPDFQDEERERIWHNYFDKLEREAGDRFYVPEGTKDYATESDAVRDLKWNGREIRNGTYYAPHCSYST